MTGNYRFQVRIRIQGDAVVQPGEQNPGSKNVTIDTIVAAVHDAMMQETSDANAPDSNDLKATRDFITVAGRQLAIAVDNTPAGILLAQNNADMAAFSMVGLYDSGLDGGNPKNSEGGAESAYWCEDILFEAVCTGDASASDVTGIMGQVIPAGAPPAAGLVPVTVVPCWDFGANRIVYGRVFNGVWDFQNQ